MILFTYKDKCRVGIHFPGTAFIIGLGMLAILSVVAAHRGEMYSRGR